jgi:sialic acid synthase SpsE
MNVYNHPIGLGHPCFVIAEIGHNHQGKLETALMMVQQAARAGANAVKFQKRDNKTLFTKGFYEAKYESKNAFGDTYGAHREALELSTSSLWECKKMANSVGLAFMVTPFDRPSIEQCELLEVDAYKIASGDVTNHELLEEIAQLKRPVFMSTGGSCLIEIQQAAAYFHEMSDRTCLMHAVSIYPTPMEELNLKKIQDLKSLFPSFAIGYSCHYRGIDAAKAARMMGAETIEKHFTFDKSAKGSDHLLSATEKEVRELIESMRHFDVMQGKGYPSTQYKNEKERSAIEKLGKGIYASKELRPGTIIEREMLAIKSPANACPPYLMQDMIGKKLKRAMKEEEGMDLAFLD